MKKKKNIIWFFVDQLRREAISINGDENVSTPNIDNLAKQGVNFTNAVGGYPLCCPCRSAILSGQYPQKTNVTGHERQLDRRLPLISDAFNSQGYDTIYFGKWHLEGIKENQHKAIIPREGRGHFKTFIGYENNNSPFDVYVHGHRGKNEIPSIKLPEYEPISLVNLAIQEVKTYSKRKQDGNETPFFMVISMQPPHDPYVAPAQNVAHYPPSKIQFKQNVPPYVSLRKSVANDLSGYYGAIESIDEQLGRLVEELKSEDMLEDTHILFFSDHGDMHGSHGQFRKTNPYEESIGVPFIIGGAKPLSYEGYKSGSSDVLVNHVDIAKTSLGLCQIPIPNEMVGTDFSSLRLEQRPISEPKDSVFLQSIIPTMHGSSVDKPWRGIVTDDSWKYICFESQEWLLFNLVNDPLELTNLVHDSDYRDIRVKLNQRLVQWIQETDDCFFVPKVV